MPTYVYAISARRKARFFAVLSIRSLLRLPGRESRKNLSRIIQIGWKTIFLYMNRFTFVVRGIGWIRLSIVRIKQNQSLADLSSFGSRYLLMHRNIRSMPSGAHPAAR